MGLQWQPFPVPYLTTKINLEYINLTEGWIQLLRDRGIAEYQKIEGTLNLADFFTKLNGRIIFDQQYALIQHVPTDEEPQEA